MQHKKLAQRLYMKLFEDASWYSSTRTEAVLMPELNEMGSYYLQLAVCDLCSLLNEQVADIFHVTGFASRTNHCLEALLQPGANF